MRRLLPCFLLPLAMLGSASAQQPWPSKPVRLILSNSAGSAPDVVARLFTEPLSRAFGQPELRWSAQKQ